MEFRSLRTPRGFIRTQFMVFLNILFKILDEEKAQYLAVAFDLKAPTFRHKMCAEYKGTRKAMPEELREQVPVMKEVLSAMGVPLLMKEGYEADDLWGTIAGQAERAGLEVSIVSGDRDLLQLATDKVQIRIPKTKRTGTEIENYYAADVKEKYLVTPTEFVDVKALMGDASDNIPGIPGIGEKICHKDHLGVRFHRECPMIIWRKSGPTRQKLSLEEHYDLAVLSKTLAKINTESPVTLDLQAAKLTDLYTPEAFTWMKKLEFKNLLSRFHVEAPKDEAADHFELADTREKAEKFLEKAAKAESFGFAWIEEKDKIYGPASLSVMRERLFFWRREALTKMAWRLIS
ncbi:MAG: 5'-3' exonuclease H3TH domain-containing protein [Lachnospiraceae bacterium]